MFKCSLSEKGLETKLNSSWVNFLTIRVLYKKVEGSSSTSRILKVKNTPFSALSENVLAGLGHGRPGSQNLNLELKVKTESQPELRCQSYGQEQSSGKEQAKVKELESGSYKLIQEMES